jgi:pyruvate formate lyase activating enzyme
MAEEDVATVFEIQKLSTEDGPGIRTTVFFTSCPLACAWCQNPEGIDRPNIQWYKRKCIGCGTCVQSCSKGALTRDDSGIHVDWSSCDACGTCVDACPSTAMKLFGSTWTLDALVAEVAKDKAYYETSCGGITASGGEPLMQARFLAKFFARCKDLGISTAIETCGLAPRSAFEAVLPHVDMVMYDLKEIDPDRHEQFTGVKNDTVLANCTWLAGELARSEKPLWIRTPIIPGYTATEENIRGIAAFIANDLENHVDRWDLLAFNNLPADKYDRMDKPWVLKGQSLLTKNDMEWFQSMATGAGITNVHWSGLTR